MGGEHDFGADPRIDVFAAGGNHQCPGSGAGVVLRDYPGGTGDAVAELAVLDDGCLAADGCSAERQRSHGEQRHQAAVAEGSIPESDMRGQ